MKVSAVMVLRKDLTCIYMEDTLEEALQLIEAKKLLSLPVLEDDKFIGVLSKQYLYEVYFKEEQLEKALFLKKQVKDFMFDKLKTISSDLRIEEAASLFIDSRERFIAVVDDKERLEGIVTQQAIFKQYQKSFGHRHNSLVIYTYDYRGIVAKITEVIAKNGGDIRNMMMFHTEVMNLVEIFIRIDGNDFDKIVRALEKQNFDVRDVKRIM